MRKSIDKHPWLLYYGIDHKVGAVGVLCPQAVRSGFSALAYKAQFWSHKTNVRQWNSAAVFFVASDEKNILPDSSSEGLFCVIRIGRYLICLVKCVGAKCTKRCCRVQQRRVRGGLVKTSNAHRYALWAIRRCALYIRPTVNLYPMYEAFCALCFRKSLKGGLCDKNVYHNRCVFMVFRFMLTHAYFCIGVLKIWR